MFNCKISLYKTIVERDWAYIAKREYNYDVTINSLAHGAFYANLVLSKNILKALVQRIHALKKMVYWPVALIPLGYYYT
jgi:hypothetical protein